MQVSCNVPYVLSVDGVVWSPIASAGGVDTYLLSTSGVVRIFINGSRYFMFTNSVVADFAIDYVECYRLVDGEYLERTDALNTYAQARFSAAEGDVYVIIKSLDLNPYELISLGASINNGVISEFAFAGARARLVVSNYDWNSYGALFIGNVLIAFVEPVA